MKHILNTKSLFYISSFFLLNILFKSTQDFLISYFQNIFILKLHVYFKIQLIVDHFQKKLKRHDNLEKIHNYILMFVLLILLILLFFYNLLIDIGYYCFNLVKHYQIKLHLDQMLSYFLIIDCTFQIH